MLMIVIILLPKQMVIQGSQDLSKLNSSFPGEKYTIPGVKLDVNCKIPGEFYASSQEGHALVYAL